MSVIDQELAMNFGKIIFAEIDNDWTGDFEQGLDEYITNIIDFPPYPNFLNEFGNFDSGEVYNLYLEEFGKLFVDHFY